MPFSTFSRAGPKGKRQPAPAGDPTGPPEAAATALDSQGPQPDAVMCSEKFRYGLVDSSVFIEPMDEPSEAAAATPRLQVDLRSGKVLSVKKAPAELQKEALGVVGAADLGDGGWALCLVTSAAWVARVDGADVYRITGTETVRCPSGPLSDTSAAASASRYAELLQAALDPKEYGEGLYFSPAMDLSLSAQRRSAAALGRTTGPQSSPQGCRRFLWNGYLAQPFDDAGMGVFVARLIMGSVQQMAGLTWSDGQQRVLGSVTVISRNSVKRAGCRQWRRGANSKGEAANFVETEQVMEFCHDGGYVEDAAPKLASFVQVRGSIPLLWSQAPNLAFKPPTHLGPRDAGKEALKRHFRALESDYGKVEALSLVSDHGAEGRLQQVYHEGMQELHQAAVAPAVSLTRFDVHRECGALTNSELPEKLIPRVEGALGMCGFFFRAGNEVERWQEGVVRTNCFDSIDRTNMAQSLIARRVLEVVLCHIDLMLQRPGLDLRMAFPAEEAALRFIWADNGDELARRYAGSGAMKSGYTRTGRMSMLGLMEDAWKGTTRYFVNCFADGRKQDAINLLLGDFRPSSALQQHQQHKGAAAAAAAASASQGSPLLTLFAMGGGVAWVIHSILHQRVWLSLVAGAVAVVIFLVRGSSLINRPSLCAGAHRDW